MSSGQGSRSALAYIAETNYGVTPTTPTLVYLPYNTHSLDLTKTLVNGQEILPDRIPRHVRHGTRAGGGGIEVEMRKGSYDALLESVMMSTWSTNVMKVGTTQKFFSIEDRAEDIAEYRLFKGMTVNSLTVSIAPNQMVMGRFEFLGKDMTMAQTSAMTGTPTADAGNEPYDSFTGTISEGGSPIAYVTALEFTINNGMQNVDVIGSQTAYSVDYGMATITGSLTCRYVDDALIDKFLGEVPSTLSVEIDDRTGTNGMTFLFPEIKYNGASVPVANPQGRLLTLPFVALYDTVEQTNLKITRNT